MNTVNEYKVQRETEWAIAKLNEPAVRLLFLVAEEEVVRMAWMLGWQQGCLTTKSEQLRELQAATDRAMGKA